MRPEQHDRNREAAIVIDSCEQKLRGLSGEKDEERKNEKCYIRFYLRIRFHNYSFVFYKYCFRIIYFFIRQAVQRQISGKQEKQKK